MKLHSITLNNIKKFKSEVKFDFSCASNMNTISGKNGAGKSTIFKSLMLAQKAYFINLLNRGQEEIGKELFLFFNNNNSYIDVKFSVENSIIEEFISSTKTKKITEQSILHKLEAAATAENCPTFEQISSFETNEIAGEVIVGFRLSGKIIKENEIVQWKIESSEKELEIINLFWNLDDPKYLIMYIESYKHFTEDDVLLSNLKLDDKDNETSQSIDFILNPDKVFQYLYRQLILDHLSERIIPRPQAKKNFYYYVGRILFKELVPDIKLYKYSGTERQGQYILVATNESNKGSYDMRELSSGEKLLFYLFTIKPPNLFGQSHTNLVK